MFERYNGWNFTKIKKQNEQEYLWKGIGLVQKGYREMKDIPIWEYGIINEKESFITSQELYLYKRWYSLWSIPYLRCYPIKRGYPRWEKD